MVLGKGRNTQRSSVSSSSSSESEEEEDEAVEKNDDEEEGVTEPAATRAPTTYPRPTPTPERPKVKYWPRPVQTRPARKGNLALVA